MAVSAIRGTPKTHSALQQKQKVQKKAENLVAFHAIEQLTESLSTKLRLSKATQGSPSKLIQALKANDFQAAKGQLLEAKNSELLASQAHTELTLDKRSDQFLDLLKKAFFYAIIQKAINERNVHTLENPLANTWGLDAAQKKLIVDALSDCNSSFARRLSQEIEAISSIDYSRHKLSPYQMLSICLVCENELTKAKEKTEQIYLRSQEGYLPRCVVIDPKRVAFTILSKKHGTLKAEGAFKRVTDAIDVTPYDKTLKARRVVRLVSKAYEEISERELIFEELYGKILSWMHYTSKHRSRESKTQILEEAFDHDMYVFTEYTPVENRKKLPLQELLQVLQDVSHTLSKMHHEGAVHHDFKTKNVLYRKLASGKVEAKVIDFGHCYRPKETQVYLRKRKKGYGTLRYTSVDALENPRLKDDIRSLAKAEDMYALGSFIYELYFQKATPWGSEVYKALKGTENREKHRKKAIRLQRDTAKDLANQANTGPAGQDTEMVWIISRLLDPSPHSRMKIDEFTNALKNVISIKG